MLEQKISLTALTIEQMAAILRKLGSETATVENIKHDIEDGAPVVTWTPVSAVPEDLGYVYRVKGKATLDDGSWSATNAASRFFKVFLEKK